MCYRYKLSKSKTFKINLHCSTDLLPSELLESFSDNTENLASGTLTMALGRKDLQILHMQTWVSAKQEMSSFDSSFVIKHQPDFILIFALLTVRKTYFGTCIWFKKPQSSQREVHITACFSFNLVYSVRVQFFLMKTKVLISATTNAQRS